MPKMIDEAGIDKEDTANQKSTVNWCGQDSANQESCPNVGSPRGRGLEESVTHLKSRTSSAKPESTIDNI